MKKNKEKPGIGVAVVIWRTREKKELLLGLGHSEENKEDIYAVPGGHWESGETLIEAAKRETKEEAGVEISDINLTSLYEFFNPEKKKSYITIGFDAIHSHGEPTVLEPQKKTAWNWYDPETALNLPLFEPDEALIERSLADVIYEPPDSQ